MKFASHWVRDPSPEFSPPVWRRGHWSFQVHPLLTAGAVALLATDAGHATGLIPWVGLFDLPSPIAVMVMFGGFVGGLLGPFYLAVASPVLVPKRWRGRLEPQLDVVGLAIGFGFLAMFAQMASNQFSA